MSWNYRIVRTNEGLQIFDVYYDEEGKPTATSALPSTVYGETVEELNDRLALVAEALNRPIVEESEIGNTGKKD